MLSIFINLNGQELSLIDQDYLDSLPEEVRKDVLEELSNSNAEDTKILKVPSSSISSLEAVKRWEQFLKNEGMEKSDRFGMQLFRSMQSTFMPVNNPNMSSKYILDYGDELQIQLIGSKEKYQRILLQEMDRYLLTK